MIEQCPGQKVFTIPGWGVRVIQPAAAAYYQKVLSYGPIAYWPLWDALGSPTAEELVNSPAQDGAHTNVTLEQPGIGDGRTSGWYDGPAATSFTNIWTAAFQAAFAAANHGPPAPVSEGTAMIWVRVNDAGVWTDGITRFAMTLYVDANNHIRVSRDNTNNRLQWRYRAGGVAKTINLPGLAELDWMHMAITWSASTPPTGEMRAYWQGAQTGVTQVALGTWAGNLAATNTVIGAYSTVPTNVWHGWQQHGAVFDYAMPPAGIADLATV